jgi:hypothetical protein
MGRGSFVLVDFATARGGIKPQGILYCCQIGNVHPSVKAVLPSAGLIWDRKPRLERVFCISECLPCLGRVSADLCNSPLQDIAVQRRILILHGLIHMSLFVSSAISFFPVRPLLYPLDSARASSSLAVTFLFVMTAENAAVGRARKATTRRRKGAEAGCRPYEHGRRGLHALQIPVCRVH